MIDIENIAKHQIERPDKWTVFGSPEDFDNMPQEHKDQIIFLNSDADKYLHNFIRYAKLIYSNDDPFKKQNFKQVEEYTDMTDEKSLKKWLFDREIPFKTAVFLLDEKFIYTTWKMVVKYSPDIFFHDDVIVFDKTLNWCLFYFHYDHLFFGRDNIYNSKDDEKNMLEINRLKTMFPDFNFPY